MQRSDQSVTDGADRTDTSLRSGLVAKKRSSAPEYAFKSSESVFKCSGTTAQVFSDLCSGRVGTAVQVLPEYAADLRWLCLADPDWFRLGDRTRIS
jgi:hypothetical protein